MKRFDGGRFHKYSKWPAVFISNFSLPIILSYYESYQEFIKVLLINVLCMLHSFSLSKFCAVAMWCVCVFVCICFCCCLAECYHLLNKLYLKLNVSKMIGFKLMKQGNVLQSSSLQKHQLFNFEAAVRPLFGSHFLVVKASLVQNSNAYTCLMHTFLLTIS